VVRCTCKHIASSSSSSDFRAVQPPNRSPSAFSTLPSAVLESLWPGVHLELDILRHAPHVSVHTLPAEAGASAPFHCAKPLETDAPCSRGRLNRLSLARRSFQAVRRTPKAALFRSFKPCRLTLGLPRSRGSNL
jgi:hypothetical protein